jgi:nicotinamide-nucleotide amidase
VALRLDATGAGASSRVEEAATRVRERLTAELGPVVFGTDRDDLAAVLIVGLRERGWRIGLAESCTGGWIAKRLTDVPGSSDVLVGGLVTYADEAKVALLGVPAELLREHGAVSAEVARAMAAGARERLGVDVAVAVTGIAGPGGGTEQKPVGLVYLTLDGPAGTRERTLRLGGNRLQIRRRTVTLALDLARRYVIEATADG